MKSKDKRHPNRTRSKLFRLNTMSAWRIFRRHLVFVEDIQLRDRLTRLVESTSALSELFANDCWPKYISLVKLRADDAMHLQNVSLFEAKGLFLKHVDDIILNEHEIRSLQDLLAHYGRIVSDSGYQVGHLKSTYLKELLINEYQETIGFKERREINKRVGV